MRHALLIVPALFLMACSADTTSSTSDGTRDTTAEEQSTVTFQPDQTQATRSPSSFANCGGAPAPFSDGDIFSLQPVRTSLPAQKVKSIALTFTRLVERNVPLALDLGGPVRGATFENAEHAQSSDEKTGVGLVAFRPDGAPSDALTSATVTVIDVATKDGEPLTARVDLHFASGDVLLQTFTGTLASYANGCGSK